MSEHLEAMEQYINEVVALAVKAEQARIIKLIEGMNLGIEAQMAVNLESLLRNGN